MKPILCKRCGTSLGQTDGASFAAGNCLFLLAVTVQCVRCGALRRWRPAEASGPPGAVRDPDARGHLNPEAGSV